ncbi:MAG: CvpA family protein [Bacteroidaceae bacterium]|jgi:membrane protein required for colicin V production|nr:CvpA family protein [Bacteroidaceae bacterium]
MWIEVACACALLYGLIRGWINGLFQELVSAGGCLIGLGVAYFYYKTVGCNLYQFVLITLGAPLALGLLATLLTKVLDKIPVAGFLNHLLGAVLGLVKWGLLAGLILLLIEKLEMLRQYVPSLMENIDSLKNQALELIDLLGIK